MVDPVWCRARLDEREDGIRRFAHSGGRLGEELDEIRTLWRDVAGREVFARYLDPFRAEVADALRRLTDHIAHLRDVVARMDDAETPAADVQRCSDEAARLRAQADLELQAAHHRVDLALNEASDAQFLADEASRTLAGI